MRTPNEKIFWHDGKVKFEDRCRLLGQKGLVVWLTGLSASGKSSMAVDLEKMLYSDGRLCYRLDGDNIRHGLNSDLGFSHEDRMENIRRIAEVARLFRDSGIIALVSFITPYESMRKLARSIIGEEAYIEVYIKADIETCSKRDVKGLYEKARKGEIQGFTGINDPFDEPKNPHIVIESGTVTISEGATQIYNSIKGRINV